MLAFCHQEMPKNTSIKDWTRDSLQELIKQLFTLPVEKSEDGPIAQLPETMTIIPREKPYPKERAETKWEKFRKSKGLKKERKLHKFGMLELDNGNINLDINERMMIEKILLWRTNRIY